MEDYPVCLMDFEERFSTEEACREYFEKLRWPDGFRCPRCGHEGYWLTKRKLYHCQQCGLQTSLLAGTVLEGSRKPLQLWFRAMWHIANQECGANALRLKGELNLGSYQTAWVWLHKLRHAMVRPGRDKLAAVVEADETYMGGERSGERGQGAHGKALVLVVVEQDEKGIGRIRLKQIPDASAESLMPAIREAVELGSTVHTDSWKGYSSLRKSGYIHNVVREEDSVGDSLLPSVHRVVSLLKRWLVDTYQGAVEPSHLDYYLDEFTFRFNRRTSHSWEELFDLLVQQAAAVDPIPAKNIRGGNHNI